MGTKKRIHLLLMALSGWLDWVLVNFPSLCGSLEYLAHHYREYEKQREVDWITGAYTVLLIVCPNKSPPREEGN